MVPTEATNQTKSDNNRPSKLQLLPYSRFVDNACALVVTFDTYEFLYISTKYFFTNEALAQQG
jgi:hypothetical protein